MFSETLCHKYLKSSFVTIGVVSDCDDGEGDVQIGLAVCVGFWFFSL